MGLFSGRFSSCGLYDDCKSNYDAPNPNPLNFIIEKIVQVGNHCVAQVKYPNCTNYEGRKILVFENVHFTEVNALKELDPHFSESGFSPVARFKPNFNGFQRAIEFARVL